MNGEHMLIALGMVLVGCLLSAVIAHMAREWSAPPKPDAFDPVTHDRELSKFKHHPTATPAVRTMRQGDGPYSISGPPVVVDHGYGVVETLLIHQMLTSDTPTASTYEAPAESSHVDHGSTSHDHGSLDSGGSFDSNRGFDGGSGGGFD